MTERNNKQKSRRWFLTPVGTCLANWRKTYKYLAITLLMIKKCLCKIQTSWLVPMLSFLRNTKDEWTRTCFLEIGHIVDEDLKINKNPELPSQESGMCFMSLKGYIWTWDKLCLALSGSIWCSKFKLGSFIQSTQVHLSPFGYIKDVPDSFNDKSGFNCWIFITYQLPLQKGMQHVSSLFGSYGAGAEPGLIPPAEGGRTGPQIYVFPNVPLPVVCRQPVVLGKKRMTD